LLGPTQFVKDRPAVSAGEHYIEDEQVVTSRAGQVQSVVAVLGHVHNEPILRKALAKGGGGFFLVFNDQDFHATTSSPSADSNSLYYGGVVSRNPPALALLATATRGRLPGGLDCKRRHGMAHRGQRRSDPRPGGCGQRSEGTGLGLVLCR